MEKVKRTSLFGALLAIIKSIGETKNDISGESMEDINNLTPKDYKEAGVTEGEINELKRSISTVNEIGSNLRLNIEKSNKFKGQKISSTAKTDNTTIKPRTTTLQETDKEK